MSFSTYKHGVKTASPAPTGDAGLAINQNFATIADYLDGVLLTSGGTLTGQLTGPGGNTFDDGSGHMTVNGSITTQEGSEIGGAGGGMQFVSTNGLYMEWDIYNSGMLELNGGLTTVLNTLDDNYGNMTINGQLNLSDGLSLVASGYNMVYFTAGNWYFANEGQLGTNGGSTLDDGSGNMTVNGTTGLSIPNGSVAVGGNTVLSPSRGYCGSPVVGQYGGTGINNGSKTITLGGNLITSGAYGITMTATATTSVTLPTSGTLATTGANTFTGDQTISTHNIITDTTTGTKIGTATAQKLGFFNATPVVQQNTTGTTTGFTASTGTTVVSGSTFTGNTGSTAYTIGDIVKALKTLGLLAS